MQQKEKFTWEISAAKVISSKQYMWTKQQSRWYETFSWFSRIYGDGDGTGAVMLCIELDLYVALQSVI